MRLSDFWERMEQQFGRRYADSVARDVVLADLSGRTPAQALEAGVPPKDVWQAVCEAFDVPVDRR